MATPTHQTTAHPSTSSTPLQMVVPMLPTYDGRELHRASVDLGVEQKKMSQAMAKTKPSSPEFEKMLEQAVAMSEHRRNLNAARELKRDIDSRNARATEFVDQLNTAVADVGKLQAELLDLETARRTLLLEVQKQSTELVAEEKLVREFERRQRALAETRKRRERTEQAIRASVATQARLRLMAERYSADEAYLGRQIDQETPVRKMAKERYEKLKRRQDDLTAEAASLEADMKKMARQTHTDLTGLCQTATELRQTDVSLKRRRCGPTE